MIRTYKYRLYPRRAQRRQLDFLLDQARYVYNAALEQRIAVYKETGKGVTYPQQWAHFRDLRRENPNTLGQLNATSMQQLLRRLDKSFKAFFRRLQAGEKAGFPRFKAAHRFRSLEFRHGDGCKLRVGERVMFHVQNVGEIKVKYHRALPEGAEIKQVVIKRSVGKWYACLQAEVPNSFVPRNTGPAMGVDMGLHSLLALSDGTRVDNPRWLRHSLAKLRKAQRRLARRKKGSRRRRKAAFQVAKLHEHIAHQRRDFWHKLTRELVATYSLIALEDLTLRFMTANHHLALSAHDAGLGEFQQLLRYKAEEAGTELVLVKPAYTSQVCSDCGVMVEKDLSIRVHRCPHCGLELDRDINAARNVLILALNSARTGRSGRNVSDCAERALRSSLL